MPCGRVKHARLKVTEPYEKEYEVTGYQRARSTRQKGWTEHSTTRKMCCPRTCSRPLAKSY